MRCLTCKYDLTHLTGPPHRCPECGREFDPENAQTFASSTPTRSVWQKRFSLIISLYPLAVLSLVYATWIVAAISLGHWPRPSLDDPKSINVAVSALYFVAVWGVIFGPIGLGVNAVTLVLEGMLELVYNKRMSWQLTLCVVLSALGWTLAFLLIRTDPGRVVYWFMD